MSQQHAQFEEEFHEEPHPHPDYQDGYSEQPSPSYTLPPRREYTSQPPVRAPMRGRASPLVRSQHGAVSTGVGARVFLAVVSMLLILGMFIGTLSLSDHGHTDAVFALAVIFAFVFTFVVLLINLIVNLVSLKR